MSKAGLSGSTHREPMLVLQQNVFTLPVGAMGVQIYRLTRHRQMMLACSFITVPEVTYLLWISRSGKKVTDAVKDSR